MPLKIAGIEEPSLNLTPMIDIVFLLIIFFMVGAQFTDADRSFQVNLPTVTETSALTALPDPAIVTVTADGSLLLDGQPSTPQLLVETLTAMKQNYPKQAVLIRGDGQADYQAVMDVLAACKRAGITGISLANRMRQEQ